MEKRISTSKIVVEESEELTDLVREIHRAKTDRIVLTFTEHTDILISSINLRVLLEAAQREDKLLIAQIIQNPTGIRNAKLAGIKTIDTPSNPTEIDWEEAEELIQLKKRDISEKKRILEATKIEDEKEIFEDNVEQNIEQEKRKGYEDRRGTKIQPGFISIDGDIPTKTTAVITDPSQQNNPSFRKSVNSFSFKKVPTLNLLQRFKSLNKKKIGKILLLTLVPIVFLSLLGMFLYNQFGTFVKVKIFVESRPIEVESILTGDTDIEELDFENLKIPIKTEVASKSLSNTITATGKAYKGEKATGKIVIFYTGSCVEETPKISLLAGQTLTTSSKTYQLVNAVEFPCDDVSVSDVSIIAENIGDEYNLSAGQSFTIVGHSETLFAKNNVAITGGTKEEYSVLSQVDIDEGVESLSATAIEEVKSELRDTSNGWEIIEDTILSEVDKSSIKTDKKVGTEATEANLDLTIKGSATYYQTKGLSEKLATLIRTQAEEDNLFESDRDLELVLGDEIEKKITVEESKKDSIRIKIVAKATIKPKIDKEKLAEELKGMEWEEGREYINSLKYAERKPEITFNPMNYPSFLKRFPERRGRVLISIIELEVSD